MERELYLVQLVEYTKEVASKFVDKETWDWIHSPPPDFGLDSSVSDIIPEEIANRIKDRLSEEGAPGYDEPVTVTIGSWENDRAIMAPPAPNTEEFYEWENVGIAIIWAKNNNIKIVDVYDGVMY